MWFHLSGFLVVQEMLENLTHERLYETNSDYRKAANILLAMEEREEMLHSDLAMERSFHKVWGAVGVLLFLYGVVYGSWLCPK